MVTFNSWEEGGRAGLGMKLVFCMHMWHLKPGREEGREGMGPGAGAEFMAFKLWHDRVLKKVWLFTRWHVTACCVHVVRVLKCIFTYVTFYHVIMLWGYTVCVCTHLGDICAYLHMSRFIMSSCSGVILCVYAHTWVIYVNISYVNTSCWCLVLVALLVYFLCLYAWVDNIIQSACSVCVCV